MLQSYQEARDWLHNQLPVGIKPGLQRMEWMMERLNHPERRLKAVHIGGTNGKGSTVAYLRNILQEAGYVVGTFTSPYIESFNERISTNGVPLSDDEFLQAANIIYPLTEELKKTELGCPTEFEVITAISMVYFAKIEVPDIVLFEVGLGGRLDSTNIIYPLLSVITNIGFDHMKFLGNNLVDIAFEKAGIIKAGIPLITATENDDVYEVFQKTVSEKRSKLYQLGREFSYNHYRPTSIGAQFCFSSAFNELNNLEIVMKGEHQVKNAALAIMTATYLKKYYSFLVDDEHIQQGLLKTKWIGRFEQVNEQPLVIIDGAHNIEGIKSLIETIKTHYPEKKVKFIFSALQDKPVEEMLDLLSGIANRITFTSFNFPRAYTAVELSEKAGKKFAEKKVVENLQEAVSKNLDGIDSESEILVITGSLYFISEVRKLLNAFTN